jgi:hypothetical protein
MAHQPEDASCVHHRTVLLLPLVQQLLLLLLLLLLLSHACQHVPGVASL